MFPICLSKWERLVASGEMGELREIQVLFCMAIFPEDEVVPY